MFPFLDALTCTMGALVVLLHVFAHSGQQEVETVARAKADANSAQAKLDLEDAQWRMQHLRDARTKTEAQLSDERLKLSHVEDHTRRLRDKLAQLKIAAEELQRAMSDKTEKHKQGAAELANVKAQLEEAKQALAASLRAGKHKSVSYSVVPYEGRHATHRRPIYIECRENLILLQPEAIELTPRDFVGFFGPGNPLAVAVRAKREYFANQAPGASPDEEPYPLLLVRPEGIASYYAARAALDSYGSDFGYELIGSDWTLKFPQPDPQLVALTRKAVAEARLRHREYTLTSPQVAKSRSRPVYHARANGGFAPVGGGGSDGLGGRGRGGWDDVAGSWATGDDQSTGGDPSGDSFDGGGTGASRIPRGAGELRDPYGDPQTGMAGSGPGSLQPSGQNTRPTGERGYSRSNPNGSLRGHPGRPGQSQAEQPGEPGMEPQFAQAGTEGQTGQHPGGTSGSRSVQPGSPGGTSSSPTMEEGSPGGASQGSDSEQQSDPSQSPGASASSPIHAGTPPSKYTPQGHGKPASIASKRGADWGLLERSVGAVAATRPVLVECYADRLIVLPESRGMPIQEIRLGERTEESMDELASAVWDHMKSWGKAGRGLYWRPTLSLNVQPGAAGRFAEIQALLADSGLDVHQRARAASATPTQKRR